MSRTALILAEANLKLQLLAGMPVSRTWKGNGTAIFLELGALTNDAKRRYPRGEVTVYVGWDWRVERGTGVLFGSSNPGSGIADGIATLAGLTIQSAAIAGVVPELLLVFSDGARLQSAAMCTATSAWDVSLPGDVWMSCVDGAACVGDGSAMALSTEDEAVFDHADATARRWGIRVADAPAGRCDHCTSMRPVDGTGVLLTYGVCTSAASPLDGMVVNDASGCAAFTAALPGR